MKRRMCVLFSMLIFLLLIPGTVRAAEGSLTVVLSDDGEPVPGGALTLYHIATTLDDGFELTPEFSRWAGQCSNDAAADLARFAMDRNIVGRQIRIGEDGTAVFRELPAGVYLVVQTEAAPGWQKILPFVVALPLELDGQYLFDITAFPKMEPIPAIPETGDFLWLPQVAAAAGSFLAAALLRRRS